MAYRELPQARFLQKPIPARSRAVLKQALLSPGQAQQAADAVAAEVAHGCCGPLHDSNGSSSNGAFTDVTALPAVILCGDMNAEPDSAACQVSHLTSHLMSHSKRLLFITTGFYAEAA